MQHAENSTSTLAIGWGDAEGRRWDTGLPVLSGGIGESLFAGAQYAGTEGEFTLYRCRGFLLGAAAIDGSSGLAAASFLLYRHLLCAAQGHHLCRIWNYVPRINEDNPDGIENYRVFCQGRSLAFEAAMGPDCGDRLPAGSAVGTDSGRLLVIFAAHERRALHLENPLQTPAYRYPAEYGPRPPSFARASVVPLADGSQHLFVSGTASVRGHRTMHAGNLRAQIDCTLENIAALGRHCGMGANPGAGRCDERQVTVYLRHERDCEETEAILGNRLSLHGDRTRYLRADICRADLDIEIEISALGVQPV